MKSKYFMLHIEITIIIFEQSKMVGSGIVKKKQKFTTKAVSMPSTNIVKTPKSSISTCTTTKSQPIEEDANLPVEVLNDVVEDDDADEPFPGTSCSTTKSAIKRRKQRLTSNPTMETLNFLKGIE